MYFLCLQMAKIWDSRLFTLSRQSYLLAGCTVYVLVATNRCCHREIRSTKAVHCVTCLLANWNSHSCSSLFNALFHFMLSSPKRQTYMLIYLQCQHKENLCSYRWQKFVCHRLSIKQWISGFLGYQCAKLQEGLLQKLLWIYIMQSVLQ